MYSQFSVLLRAKNPVVRGRENCRQKAVEANLVWIFVSFAGKAGFFLLSQHDTEKQSKENQNGADLDVPHSQQSVWVL